MRMNFGSGSVLPDGWCNVDRDVNALGGEWVDYLVGEPPHDGEYWIDVREQRFHSAEACGGGPGGFPPQWSDCFDYIVANHSLSDLTFHELPHALSELYRVLKPGGVLRVLVPDLLGAIYAYEHGDGDWFPQGDDLVSVDERFATFVVWFGTVGSVFTPQYLRLLLSRAGFVPGVQLQPGKTNSKLSEITSLDGDRTTSLIIEGVK